MCTNFLWIFTFDWCGNSLWHKSHVKIVFVSELSTDIDSSPLRRSRFSKDSMFTSIVAILKNLYSKLLKKIKGEGRKEKAQCRFLLGLEELAIFGRWRMIDVIYLLAGDRMGKSVTLKKCHGRRSSHGRERENENHRNILIARFWVRVWWLFQGQFEVNLPAAIVAFWQT